jgi:predicted DNA-binding protein
MWITNNTKNMKDKQKMTIELPIELHKRLKLHGVNHRKTMNLLIEEALEKFLIRKK